MSTTRSCTLGSVPDGHPDRLAVHVSDTRTGESATALRYRAYACWAAHRGWEHAGCRACEEVLLAVEQYLKGEKTFAEMKALHEQHGGGAAGAGICGVPRGIPTAYAQIGAWHTADDDARAAAFSVMRFTASAAAYAEIARALETGGIVLPPDEANSSYVIASAARRYPWIECAAREREERFLSEKLAEWLALAAPGRSEAEHG